MRRGIGGMRLASGGRRRQELFPAVMVAACAVLAACGLAAGELTRPDDTTAQTINPTETTQTTVDSTGTTATTLDPTGTTATTADTTGTTQTTADPTETTETTGTTVDSTGTTQTTADPTETEVTLAPPGVAPPRKDLTFPVMIAAPGGFVVGEPGAENAVQMGDAKEMLERGALSIAYDFWGLVEKHLTPCPVHRLRVSWEGPDHVFGPDADIRGGAHTSPLGPPQAGEDRAAGIVYCKGSDSHYYMGFDAVWKPELKAWSMHPEPVG